MARRSGRERRGTDMRKAMAWMSGCLGLGLLLMACDSPTSSGTPIDILGTWKITSVHNKGWSLDAESVKHDVDEDDSSQIGETRRFNADSTFVFDNGLTGKWSISGNTLTTLLTVEDYTDTTTTTVTIDGKEGVFVSHLVSEEMDIFETIKATKQ